MIVTQRVYAALRRVAGAGAVAAASLLAIGCPRAVDYFPEYRDGDGNRNLIADRSLSVDWQLGSDLAILSDPSIYLEFTAVEEVDPPEGASTETTTPEVYRVEFKNLLPDGAFAQSDPGAIPTATPYHGWRMHVVGTDPQTWEIVDSGAGVINANTLHYTTTAVTDRLDFDLRDPAWGARDGLVEGALYLVRFSYRSAKLPVIFEFGDHEEALSLLHWTFYSGPGGGIAGSSLENLLEFPPAVKVDQYDYLSPTRGIATYYLSFGSVEASVAVSVQDAYIDNLRLIRADIPPVVELRLPYLLSTVTLAGGVTTDLTLISGRYRFSVWIRQDPEAETAAAPNRYRARAVGLSVSGGGLGEAYAGSTVTYRQSFTDSDGTWDDWTRLSMETDTIQITPPTDAATPVLTLAIAPTDWFDNSGMNMDAGTILVSAPTLEFISAR